MSVNESIRALRAQGIDVLREDYLTLSTWQVGRVLAEADACKYRKPRNANGSRGRYFYAYLARVARRNVPLQFVGQVHRFHDRVALATSGSGKTVYVRPETARAFAKALYECARDIDRAAFVNSTFSAVELKERIK